MNCSLFMRCVLVFSVFTVQNTVHSTSSNNVDVRELVILSDAALRYAKVLVRSVMINQKSDDQEVTFKVRLPKEAFITSFIIITENRTIEAVIREKKKAQDTYNKAKEDNVTAGLVSQQGISDDLDLDIFSIEVNVAANSEVEFRLEYEEFLQRDVGKYTQKLFIDSDHVVPILEVKCMFREKQKFKYLSYKTPYHKQRVIVKESVASEDGYFVNTVNWKPSKTDQEEETVGFDAPFEVEYELELEDNGGMLFLNNEGNFVYMFSVPFDESEVMVKQIVFVIDISGSMSGNPILQVRQAMMSILSQLRPHDYFCIIIFDDVTAMWKTSFQQANSDNINAAKLFIQSSVKASGATNINDALIEAIDLFGKSESVERYGQIIMFLTDGEPTAGVTHTSAIRKNVRDRNYVRGDCCKSTIYTIAFGRNADIEFLKLIANENAGTSTVIKEIESNVADGELISTYRGIENPCFKNLIFSFEVEGELLPETSITQGQLHQFDCKSELVISGWTAPGKEIRTTVKGEGSRDGIVFNSVPTVLILDEQSKMLTRLYAYQRVKQWLKEAELALDADEMEEAKNKALNFSLQYRFVTPLTSLVVTDSAPTQRYGPVYDDYELAVLASGGKVFDTYAKSMPTNQSDKLLCMRIDLLAFLFVISKYVVTNS